MSKTTYTEFVKEVAAESGLSQEDARKALDAMTTVLTQNLRGGLAVAVKELGTFKPRESAARQGRNPRTGEVVNIPAKNSVSFTSSQSLKDALN